MYRSEALIKEGEDKLIESLKHCVDLSKWVHSAMNKEQRLAAIKKYKGYIRDLEESE